MVPMLCVTVVSPLDTLSRLKGIETRKVSSVGSSRSFGPLDTLSRLKGIETHRQILDWIYL